MDFITSVEYSLEPRISIRPCLKLYFLCFAALHTLNAHESLESLVHPIQQQLHRASRYKNSNQFEDTIVSLDSVL